jgi:hypothetical protein
MPRVTATTILVGAEESVTGDRSFNQFLPRNNSSRVRCPLRVAGLAPGSFDGAHPVAARALMQQVPCRPQWSEPKDEARVDRLWIAQAASRSRSAGTATRAPESGGSVGCGVLTLAEPGERARPGQIVLQ